MKPAGQLTGRFGAQAFVLAVVAIDRKHLRPCRQKRQRRTVTQPAGRSGIKHAAAFHIAGRAHDRPPIGRKSPDGAG